jgi:hypothetical protein
LLYTYRQEYAVNIVSNPYFTSSSIVHRGPASKLEMAYYRAPNHTQSASDVNIFPNIINDPYNKSAFWTLGADPHMRHAAGEMLPSAAKEYGQYYLDPLRNGHVIHQPAMHFFVHNTWH